MAVTYTFTRILNDGGGTLSNTITISADAASVLSGATGASTSPFEIDVAFAHANLKGFFVKCDRNMTIKSNSSGSPDSTIAIVGGQGLEWAYVDPWTNPFNAADVTKLFLVNAAATVNNYEIRVLYDSTP